MQVETAFPSSDGTPMPGVLTLPDGADGPVPGLLMIYVITLLLGNLPYVGSWLVGPIALAVWKLFDVLFIGLIQAFIFMLLTMVYFGLAREGLEEEHAHSH